LKHISIKLAQFDLQKCITWPKKSGKGRHEWIKVKHPCQNKVGFW
jgi:hypothetical protein